MSWSVHRGQSPDVDGHAGDRTSAISSPTTPGADMRSATITSVQTGRSSSPSIDLCDEKAHGDEPLVIGPLRVVHRAWMDRLVVHETNACRAYWNYVLTALLLYTGSFFPFRMCFYEFGLPEPRVRSDFIVVFDHIVDALFWVDFFLHFVFSYRGQHSQEVVDLRKIVAHYARTMLAINLIACLPVEMVEAVILLLFGDSSETRGIDQTNSTYSRFSGHQSVRLLRLQRLTRLAGLVRMVRLTKLLSVLRQWPFWLTMTTNRSMGILKSLVGFMWAVHILACGWFLCGSLHSDARESWIARRFVDADGLTQLFDQGPAEQWWHSMYFVLTVFTTVGFGDMSAMTTGEIIYGSFTMVVGVVVNSVIVTQIINIVTANDASEIDCATRVALVDCFAKHTEMEPRMAREVKQWAQKHRPDVQNYDRQAAKELLLDGQMPQDLERQLPSFLFQGRLLSSKLIGSCLMHMREVPSRLTVLLALALDHRTFVRNEIVYQLHDHPFNLFLVDVNKAPATSKEVVKEPSVFAHVGRPMPEGGVDAAPDRGLASHMPATNIVARLLAKKSDGVSSDAVGNVSASVSHRVRRWTSVAQQPLKPLHDSANVPTPQPPRPRERLYPYHVVNAGNYFGELELLENIARRSTVRCETASGAVLVLVKHLLFTITEEFPHVYNAWHVAARRREAARVSALSRLTRPKLDYRGTAALIVQMFVRERMGFRDFKRDRGDAEAPRSMMPRKTPGRLSIGASGCGRQAELGTFGSRSPRGGSEIKWKLQVGVRDICSEVKMLRMKLAGEEVTQVKPKSVMETGTVATVWKRRVKSGRLSPDVLPSGRLSPDFPPAEPVKPLPRLPVCRESQELQELSEMDARLSAVPGSVPL